MTKAFNPGEIAQGASPGDVRAAMRAIGAQARAAARALANAPAEAKTHAIAAAARILRERSGEILAANARDLAEARAKGLAPAFLDRLALDPKRVEQIARGLEDVAALPDPVGRVLAVFERPNGLKIERVATPLGVVGVIYESRPNVTADAGALCLKSGNAVVLRGGSDSFHSSAAIHACLVAGLKEAGLPEAAISRAPSVAREAVGEMLEGLGGALDVIVPRGGKSLVERVQREARVPVFAHLEGVVHVYVDRAADLDKALKIVVNSKMRRTGVCGAAETLLVDRGAAPKMLAPLVKALIAAGCAVRGDAATQAVDPAVSAAQEADWATNISMRSSRSKSSTGSTRRSRISRPTARTTPIASSPRTRKPPSGSSGRSTRRSCCTTPRRNSPTAANSASAPRSASPPAACTRAAPSASNSSARSSTASTATARRGGDGRTSVEEGARPSPLIRRFAPPLSEPKVRLTPASGRRVWRRREASRPHSPSKDGRSSERPTRERGWGEGGRLKAPPQFNASATNRTSPAPLETSISADFLPAFFSASIDLPTSAAFSTAC